MPAISDIDYSILPEHIRDGMKRYVEHGIQPGGFLCAVLENNFLEAFVRADSINTARMADIAAFVYSELPRECHGSQHKMTCWIERHAMEREAKTA